MTPEEHQLQLNKYRDIIFATIEYDNIKDTGRLKPQELAYAENFHRVWKEHVEAQYRDKELEKLKKSLDHISLQYKISADLDFVNFIKEKTGYDFDLFGNIYERIGKIITRNRITNRKERNDVSTILQLYRRTSVGQENAALLLNLINEFDNSNSKNKLSIEMMSLVKYLTEINSPDNKKYINMYESSCALYSSTIVNIVIGDRTSSLYAAEGINLSVKLYWKDNNTVVIETKKDYPITIKQTTVQYLQDIVYVEYAER